MNTVRRFLKDEQGLETVESSNRSFTAASAAIPHDARSRANMALALGLLGREAEAEALYLQVLPAEDARHNLDLIAVLRGGGQGGAPSATAP